MFRHVSSYLCDVVVVLNRNVHLRLSGLSNPEEFAFTSDEETQDQTSRRMQQQQVRDHKKLDTLKKKLHTDDECKLSLLAHASFELAICAYVCLLRECLNGGNYLL